MDIKTVYLNADIDTEIFMKQPERFEKFDQNGKPLVGKLVKSWYGLSSLDEIGILDLGRN